MNICLIGFGYWGKNLARVLSRTPGCNLHSIIEPNIDHIKLSQYYYPHAKVFRSHEDNIPTEEIDAIVIASPVHTQLRLVQFFLGLKKHVFCEKVLSTDANELIHLKNLAITNDVILMVGYTFLYNDVIRDMKTRIDNRDLGQIHYATFKRTGLGPIREDVDVITDLAVHDISIAIHLFGVPQRAACTKRAILKAEKADVAFLQLGYDSGFIINIHVSWMNPMKQRVVEVVGEKQMLIFDDVSTTEKLRIINAGKDYLSEMGDFGTFQLSIKDGDIIIPNIPYQEPLANEINHFIQKISDRFREDVFDNMPLQVASVIAMLD